MKSLELSKNTITSIEIAELSGMTHDNVLKAIRKMEPAWISACQKFYGDRVNFNAVNFNAVDLDLVNFNEILYEDSYGRKQPMYELTKSQSLFVATKFNDEARALLVLRWEQLEIINHTVQNGMGIEYHNGQPTLSTRSISSTTGIQHDEIIRWIKKYLDEHTEVLNGKRYPRKGHLNKGKFLIDNIWELSIFSERGVPQKEYMITRDGFNYIVKWYGFLALSGFLPQYSKSFEVSAHMDHLKSLG